MQSMRGRPLLTGSLVWVMAVIFLQPATAQQEWGALTLLLAALVMLLGILNIVARGLKPGALAQLVISGLLLQAVLSVDSVRAQQAVQTVAIYAIAHQDDWQLFMNPNAFNDVRRAGTKVVFIYTTAGDAGLRDGPYAPLQPYFLAREEGAKRAARFMADEKSASANGQSETVTIAGHDLYRYIYKNTVSYFLRLPDGFPRGQGHPGTGYTSLQMFRAGTITSFTAVNSSTTYEGWNDLVRTVRELIRRESVGAAETWLNIQNPDTVVNPNDHSDHLHTGQLLLDVRNDLPCLGVNLYTDYHTASLPLNLSHDDLLDEAAVYGVTVSGRADFGHAGTWDAGHKAWLGRNYFSTLPGRGNSCLQLSPGRIIQGRAVR